MAFQILCFFKHLHNSFTVANSMKHYYQIANDSFAIDSYVVAIAITIMTMTYYEIAVVMKYSAIMVQYC